MSEANKALVRRVLEQGFNEHNIAIFTELYGECVYHSPAVGELRGKAYLDFMASMLKAFPDGRITLEDQFAEADKVVSRWTFVGTHRGEFMGIAATGKRITGSGMAISRILGNQIVEEWEEVDFLGMMRQLGVLTAHMPAVAA